MGNVYSFFQGHFVNSQRLFQYLPYMCCQPAIKKHFSVESRHIVFIRHCWWGGRAREIIPSLPSHLFLLMKTRWRPKRSNVRTLKIHLHYRFSNDGPVGHCKKKQNKTKHANKKNVQIKERNHTNKKERQPNENGSSQVLDENMQIKVKRLRRRRNDGQESTSFPGSSPSRPLERERERPWKTLVTCLPESGRWQNIA